MVHLAALIRQSSHVRIVPPQRNQSRCTPESNPLSGFFLKKKLPLRNLSEAKCTLVPLENGYVV